MAKQLNITQEKFKVLFLGEGDVLFFLWVCLGFGRAWEVCFFFVCLFCFCFCFCLNCVSFDYAYVKGIFNRVSNFLRFHLGKLIQLEFRLLSCSREHHLKVRFTKTPTQDNKLY